MTTHPENQKLSKSQLDVLFGGAYTTRQFKPGSIDVAAVEEVWNHVKFAPTAFNSVPMRMTLIESEGARERLLPHLAKGNQPATQNAPLTIICATDPSFPDVMESFGTDQSLLQYLRSDATLVDGIATTSAWLQAAYLILGLRAHGYAVGPMTGADMAGLDKEFHGESGWKSFLVINVGQGAEGLEFQRAGRPTFQQVSQVL